MSWAWVLTPIVSELRSLLAESTSAAVLLNLWSEFQLFMNQNSCLTRSSGSRP